MNTRAYKHIDNLDQTYFDFLRIRLVPASGMANTVAGEIIRAMDRLIYRYYNDGDRPYDGYGNETCNGSFRYLRDVLGQDMPDFEDAKYKSDDEYEELLDELATNVKEFLEARPELLDKENITDSRTTTDEDRRLSYEEDDDEYSCRW